MNTEMKQTVLLVDDDPMVLGVAKKLLERLGYDVLKAGGGEEAITRAINNIGEISIVILDMVMPGMNGKTTYYKIREVLPEAKVIICSGFADSEQIEELREAGAVGFIRKPFDRESLEEELKRHKPDS